MALPPLTTSAKLKLLAAGLALLGVFAFAWHLRRAHHLRVVAACRELREEITALKRDEFDVHLEEMRTIRLNPSQAQTLRNTDPEAFASYAASYSEVVDEVAAAADRLGEKVDRFTVKGCVDLG